MALTKVEQVTLLAIENVESNTSHVGAAVDVATYYAADVRIRMGRATATAFTTAPKFRIEGTYDNSSPTNQQWVTLAEFQAVVGATIGSQVTSSGDGAGSTAVTLAAGTNFAAGDYVFFHHTTLGSSEWHRVVSISGAVITIEEALIIEQVPSTVRDQAEQYHALLDLTGIQKIRLVCESGATGQAYIVAAEFGAVSAL